MSQTRRPGRTARRIAFAAVVLSLGLPASPPAGAQDSSGPFASLAGSWTGAGTLKLASGDSERLRCRVSYEVGDGGRSVRQDLRCASDSYNFDVESDMSYNAGAGRVSGTWAETNYSTGGFLSGTVNGGDIRATVEGRSFAAAVAVTTSGDAQMVTIRPESGDVTEVAVTFRKSS